MIELLCLQTTKIPSPSVEQRSIYGFVFASSAEGVTDHHEAGFCYNRRIEKYRDHYIQHTSH